MWAGNTVKVIAVVSQKGGSGKTTVAIHLATAATSAGYVTAIVDTDPQATAAAWSDWRAGKDPEVITAPPARLARTLEQLAKAGAQLVIIDTPPHADSATREAVKLADLALIPCRPRAFDLHAVQTTGDLIKHSGKPAAILFNSVPPRAPALMAEARAIVEKLGFMVCPVTLAERAAFHQATGGGQVASETSPKGKANNEVEALWTWTCGQVDLSTRPRRKKSKE